MSKPPLHIPPVPRAVGTPAWPNVHYSHPHHYHGHAVAGHVAEKSQRSARPNPHPTVDPRVLRAYVENDIAFTDETRARILASMTPPSRLRRLLSTLLSTLRRALLWMEDTCEPITVWVGFCQASAGLAVLWAGEQLLVLMAGRDEEDGYVEDADIDRDVDAVTITIDAETSLLNPTMADPPPVVTHVSTHTTTRHTRSAAHPRKPL